MINNRVLYYNMAQTPNQSPDISQKQKRKQKRQKLKAFQSFLQKGEAPQPLDLVSTNLSDNQQKLEPIQQQNGCVVCAVELGDRKKNCGFCNQPACNEHMRKKRKNKETNKFARICDNCEDKFLFNKYMKLELKNQQWIAAQEIIVTAKKEQLDMQLKGRKTKLLLLEHRQKEVLNNRKDYEAKLAQQENDYKTKNDKLEKKLKQIHDLENYLKELQAKLPPSFEEDFHTLQIQNQKVNKELLRYEKLCTEAIKAKSKREKEIYQEYNQWQQAQRQKINKKQEDCAIF